MFWGLVMEPGKRYAQTVDKSFHISMACMEPNSSDNDFVPVMLDIENQEYILCNLHKHKGIQCQLDLNFRTGSKIAFFSSGKSRVHLTGYVIEDEDEDSGLTGDVSDEELEEEEETSPVKDKKKLVNSNVPQNKRKSDGLLTKSDTKKAKISIMNQVDSDDDDDDDEDDDDDLVAQFGESDESEDELSGEESEEEEEEEDDESDDMVTTQVQKTPDMKKKDKQNKTPNKTPMEKMNNLNKTKTPVDNQEQKKKKKSINPQEGTPKTPGVTGDENGKHHPTPHPSKKNKKKLDESPAVESPKPDQSPTLVKKTLQGGVNIHDIKVGNGPVAKSGKRVTVYYVGRLKQNNKQFDATTQGPGFKFQLGGGEVIKGWDIGVAGMRVGGKRRIICPPHMAYGNKGSPPAIPPNSSLVFEVELRAVN
ncbi:46 kDa FK506-binding nuclear protein [Anabrus simplex]|uniref:46 kDa FK506-binding nuclear protein n=1 Tax=Anabrus simplex TaxID=316456 RepID=UPI0035A30F1E